jgi:hypothetical protein
MSNKNKIDPKTLFEQVYILSDVGKWAAEIVEKAPELSGIFHNAIIQNRAAWVKIRSRQHWDIGKERLPGQGIATPMMLWPWLYSLTYREKATHLGLSSLFYSGNNVYPVPTGGVIVSANTNWKPFRYLQSQRIINLADDVWISLRYENVYKQDLVPILRTIVRSEQDEDHTIKFDILVKSDLEYSVVCHRHKLVSDQPEIDLGTPSDPQDAVLDLKRSVSQETLRIVPVPEIITELNRFSYWYFKRLLVEASKDPDLYEIGSTYDSIFNVWASVMTGADIFSKDLSVPAKQFRLVNLKYPMWLTGSVLERFPIPSFVSNQDLKRVIDNIWEHTNPMPITVCAYGEHNWMVDSIMIGDDNDKTT